MCGHNKICYEKDESSGQPLQAHVSDFGEKLQLSDSVGGWVWCGGGQPGRHLGKIENIESICSSSSNKHLRHSDKVFVASIPYKLIGWLTYWLGLIPSVCAPDEDAQLRTDLLACLVSEAKDTLQDIYQISESEGSDSESSSESVSDDWDQIASDMRTDVECLIDLEPLIKCPFIDSRKAKSHQTQTTETPQWTPLKLYSDRIANRFPVAQAELVERLARANWDRFQRIQLEKERNIVNRDDERVAQEADLTTPTETGSAFQDSGLGTSLRTGSRYAETVMSYKQDNGHSIKVPQLPPEAKNGTPFCCLACGRRVRIRGDTMWK